MAEKKREIGKFGGIIKESQMDPQMNRNLNQELVERPPRRRDAAGDGHTAPQQSDSRALSRCLSTACVKGKTCFEENEEVDPKEIR